MPRRDNSYHPDISSLKRVHRSLFDKDKIVLSLKESQIFYAREPGSSVLTLHARCPYQASVDLIDLALYMSYNFLSSHIVGLGSGPEVLVSQTCNALLSSPRGYSIFYGYSADKESLPGSYKQLHSFQTVKDSVNYNFSDSDLRLLLHEEFSNSSIHVREIVNSIFIFTIYLRRYNVIFFLKK